MCVKGHCGKVQHWLECVMCFLYFSQDGQPDILHTFWSSVTQTLSEELQKATAGEFQSEVFV